MPESRRAHGPGRVNLIGDHTDYNQGVALPMAIDLGVTVTYSPADDDFLVVTSSDFEEPAEIDCRSSRAGASGLRSDGTLPAWARLVEAMVALCGDVQGGTLVIDSTLPVGAGLSSSAALSVALAEVFGATGSAGDIARLSQAAEHRLGVPVGLMDPLVCAGGRAGHALLIEFDTLATRSVPMPPEDDAVVVVVDSGQRRTLATSAYAARVAECRAAAEVIGPLGRCRPEDLRALDDPVLRSRAQHVVSECARVWDTADALGDGDLIAAGRLLTESHRSLAEAFAVSTPTLDGLVAQLDSRPGVFGARMTGGGFGGCVVALARPGAIDRSDWPGSAWTVHASDGTLRARGRPRGPGYR